MIIYFIIKRFFFHQKVITAFFVVWCNSLLFSQEGFLKIESPQAGLIITLNDSIIGKTPLALLKINCGTYRLSVLNPQKGIWKNDDWLQQIQIVAEDTTIVKPVLKQKLIIRSNPFDAQVLIDNKYIGNTPIYLDLPPSKERVLIIKKERYKPYLINLLNNTPSTLNITLEPITKLQKSFHKIQVKKEKKFHQNKKLTYTLMAFTICTGFATAYFKNQAELKYEQYLIAGNIEDMNRNYNDTKRLDKISSVSLGIFEVSFVLSFYFLIKTVGH